MAPSQLPPLATLRPFEAAARLGSMSAAARELGVTQPAISRQLAQLERDLGRVLFARTPQGIALTPAGETLQAAVAEAFGLLAGAAAHLRPTERDRTVRLAAHAGFAQLWLAPRLADLRATLPDAFFQLTSGDRDADFAPGEYDLAVRFGTGTWPGCTTRLLLAERIVPVCAPSYLAQRPALRNTSTAAALLGERLLHLDEVSQRWFTWTAWFAAHGAGVTLDRPRLLYASYPLLLQAALAGEGIALGWLGLVDEALERGTLVPLLPALERRSHGYFLCRGDDPTSSLVRRRLIDAVADWFVDQAQRCVS